MLRPILILLFPTLAGAALITNPASAMVHMPAIFGDHMVLQADRPVSVFGRGDPGERVTVSFAKQKVVATTAADGHWHATLLPMSATSVPQVLTIAGSNEFRYADVLVGQVWIGSGQSNMETPLIETIGADTAFAAADIPTLRLFKVEKRIADTPADDVSGHWIVSTPEAVRSSDFSAVGFYFGRRLGVTLRQPVGVIESSYGGTQIEPWLPGPAAAAEPSVVRYATTAHRIGSTVKPVQYPSVLWNAMIKPLVPYTIAGVIWYQGESNVLSNDNRVDYAAKMRRLISSWRDEFDAQIPFYMANIAPFNYYDIRGNMGYTRDTASEIRAAQIDVSEDMPGSGIVMTYDTVTDPTGIHPREKQPIGERFADLALSRTYGHSEVPASGPRLLRAEVKGKVVVLRFKGAVGLSTRDQAPPSCFEIAGSDGRFVTATATLVGDTINLTSYAVPQPIEVRFGWGDIAQPNLIDRWGLPAVPFAQTTIIK